MKFAVIIAVEDYANGGSLKPIPYSVACAADISDAVAAEGCAKTNQMLLLQSTATKAIIESRLRKLMEGLSADDSLMIYFSGYLLSQNGQNLLTSFDTQLSDIETTTVSLATLVDQVRQTECQHFGLFLNGTDLSTSVRDTDSDDLVEPFDRSVTEQAFGSGSGHVCFGACGNSERSHHSNLLNSNIWAFHLNRALAGLAVSALDRQNQLSAGSLQSYLCESVSAELKKAFSIKPSQTPWMVGDASFLLADLTEVIADRQARKPRLDHAGQVSLVHLRKINIRSLTGFHKTHSVPTEIDARSMAFVGRIARGDLDRDLDAVYDQLRKTFRFKRLDIVVDSSDEGFGSIRTPHFDYAIAIAQSTSDPDSATLRREVTNIQQLDQILSDGFSDVFESVFDTLEFAPQRQVNVEALIDRIEQSGDRRIQLQYDRDATWCQLVIDGIDAMIRITDETVEIIKRKPALPRTLIELFLELQQALVDEHEIQLLPAE